MKAILLVSNPYDVEKLIGPLLRNDYRISIKPIEIENETHGIISSYWGYEVEVNKDESSIGD